MANYGVPGGDWRAWNVDRLGSAARPVEFSGPSFGPCGCGEIEPLLRGETALPHGLCCKCRGERAELRAEAVAGERRNKRRVA